MFQKEYGEWFKSPRGPPEDVIRYLSGVVRLREVRATDTHVGVFFRRW